MNTFDHLIAPVGRKEFRDCYFGRRTLRIPRRDPGYFADIFSDEAMDRIISSIAITPSELELMADGIGMPKEDYTYLRTLRKGDFERTVDVKKVYALYDAGATIYMDRVDFYDAKLTELCAHIDELFYCKWIKASSLATPANSQGFGVHFDTHDVAVLQISGKKKWRLYEATVPFSTYFQEYRIDSMPKDALIDEIVLEPGDFLYFPRGIIHEALTVDDTPSLHVTISMAFHTWNDYLEELIDHAGSQDRRFQRPIPLDLLQDLRSGQGGEQAVAERTAELLSRLADTETALGARQRMWEAFLGSRRPRMQSTVRALDALVSAQPERLYRVRPRLQHDVVRRNGCVDLVFAQTRLAFPHHHEQALAHLSRGEVFSARDLPGLTAEEQDHVVHQLVVNGFFVPARDEQCSIR